MEQAGIQEACGRGCQRTRLVSSVWIHHSHNGRSDCSAFKSYAKSAIQSDHSTTTLQRIVEVGCGIFWGPQWDGSYIRHVQKHIEHKYNIATDIRVITNLGRQAIKDLSKKVSYILWTICRIKVYQNNSAMSGANSIIDKPSNVC